MKTIAIIAILWSISVASGFRIKKNFPISIQRSQTATTPTRVNLLPELHDVHQVIQPLVETSQSFITHSAWLLSDEAAPEVISAYQKVDKTGFFGFFATYIEICIDFGNQILNKIGVKNAYGYSIILFTLLVKTITLPLTVAQLESTSQMQKLTPIQKRIQEKFAKDEETKNKVTAQLFQAANVNPLAGCFPALVQIPIFISLYRALTNLVAEHKLGEPFLWIPDLEGPVYDKPTSQSMDWLKSIVTGEPLLGWHDTIAFLSIPLILYVTQTISSKVLQPPKDPNKALTDQEQFSQNLITYLPFIVAFFSINVPAGLGVYWIFNNMLTTLTTVVIKQQIKNEPFPPEVDQVLALLDTPARPTPRSELEIKALRNIDNDRPKPEGFAVKSLSSQQSPAGEELTVNTIPAVAVDSGLENVESNVSDNTIEEKLEKKTAGKRVSKKGKKKN